MLQKTFHIQALGCKVSQYDAAVLRRLLEQNGLKIDSAGRPDLLIINTCAVTKKAVAKDKRLIQELRRAFPESFLVVMGCWPQTDSQAGLDDDKRCLFWGVGRLEELADKLLKEIGASSLPPNSAVSNLLESGLLALTDRSRYFLKVGDGCNQFCSYCIIPFARGRLRSRSISELITEAESAVLAGYREIVLSGIHLGLYGTDFKRNARSVNLASLIKKLLNIKNLGRLRLSSIEITEVSDELVTLLAREKQLCRHLHISLQSGSNRILKLMKRPYTKEFFAERIFALKRAMPDIAISTDVIVGFPGESEKEFLETCRFARCLKFSKLHVFSFSAHEQTAAFNLSGYIAPLEIKNRSRILRALSEELEDSYQRLINKRYKRQPLRLIKEKSGRRGVIRAKTEFGFDLLLSPPEAERHEFI